ncbi:MAG: uracil-DNA glycosylase [Desulfurococcales archaeon]|nr:uracil-DNA glycosylase [Desulfurococcales archaeon]
MEDVKEMYNELVKRIRECTKCPLHTTRRNPVPGEGPLEAEVMLIGEAPGRREDELGRPFVGMAGKLLDELLNEVGMPRRSVYITNVIKCRPPGNRDPRPEEIQACLPYLIRQIQLIRPRIIVALGRISAKTLHDLARLQWKGISKEHGKVKDAVIAGVKVKMLATYHPAAALYNPRLRDYIREDLRKASLLREASEPGYSRRTLEDFF